MVTTTRRMLEELRRPELFEQVLEEVARVRAEMGYPIIVTPGLAVHRQPGRAQRDRRRALGERLRRDRALLPRPLRRAAGAGRSRRSPIACSRAHTASKLRGLEPISLEGARERFGARISEEELLLRLTMPEEQVDAMVAAREAVRQAAAGVRGPGARRW